MAQDPQLQTVDNPAVTDANPVVTKPVIAEKPKSSIIRAVLVAVVIAIILIGLGFVTYNAKNEPKPIPEGATSTEADSTTPVDEQTIDDQSEEIDQTMQDLNNDTDFDQSELDDQNLGL